MLSRRDDLVRFYALLDRLSERIGGPRQLAECHGRMDWPRREVYFFLDARQPRTDSGTGWRVVRVGTHAINAKSRTTLWMRLSQHRGVASTGAGNHRGSIFRLLVGAAMKRRAGTSEPPSWGVGATPGAAAAQLGTTRDAIVAAEAALERGVSDYIGALPFLWLGIDGDANASSRRADVERNAIGLLSNYRRPDLDTPSTHWLGAHSDRERVRESGLWNNNHVDAEHSAEFLDEVERL